MEGASGRATKTKTKEDVGVTCSPANLDLGHLENIRLVCPCPTPPILLYMGLQDPAKASESANSNQVWPPKIGSRQQARRSVMVIDAHIKHPSGLPKSELTARVDRPAASCVALVDRPATCCAATAQVYVQSG